MGAGSTIIAVRTVAPSTITSYNNGFLSQTPPSLYVFATSRVETGPGCPWLRGWLLLTLLLQWAQFPYRALLYYKLIAIGRARLEDIAGHLGGIVRSKQWHIIKVLGYAVYTMFAVGVVISWYFAVSGGADCCLPYMDSILFSCPAV